MLRPARHCLPDRAFRILFSRVSRAALGGLLLSACVGSAVDLKFFSDPPATLTHLELDVSSDGGSLLHTSFLTDGGTLTLPQSVRLLVDVPELDVHATAFDTDGGTRQASGQLFGLAGGTTPLELDLSAVSWCPAPPASADETVIYDEMKSTVFLPFPYVTNAPLPESTDSSEACTGSHALHYTITAAIDGVGFHWSPARTVRHVSLRLSASDTTPWAITLGQADAGIVFLPTPGPCANDQTLCAVQLTPQWQWFAFDVPPEVPPVVQLAVANEFGGSHSVTINVDDVRVVFAQ
jgi:hypothetical protein